MADKIIRAAVEGDRPVFINGILHLPGEDAYVNLGDLGVDGLGKKTPGLVKKSAAADENVAEAPVAAVAPHAPDAPNPQGIATGTRISGTGRLIAPPNSDGEPAIHAVGADSEVAKAEAAAPAKPHKPSK